MRKFVSLSLLFASLLSACTSAVSPLWGVRATPTPQEQARVQIEPTAPIVRLEPSRTPTPTAIPTPTRPPIQIVQGLTATPAPIPTFDLSASDGPPVLYYTQSGDTLKAVAAHFGVKTEQITSPGSIPDEGLILPNTLLIIPDVLDETAPATLTMPDSEVSFTATGVDFEVGAYVRESGGYLAKYKEYLGSTGWTSGVQGIERICIENSINPRLMVALIEYESGWVTGQPKGVLGEEYPLGYPEQRYKGLFRQMMLAVQDLMIGYYDWRSGDLTELTFTDGESLRLSPQLNAGTVAIQYYFAQKMTRTQWLQAIDPVSGFPAFYTQMFGDPWVRASTVEPLFPPNLAQPDLSLPFEPGREWNYTGGPHSAWEHEGAMAALDFAPSSDKSGCVESEKWILAAESGLVVRSGFGVVVLDLDGDGYEQTGWNLLYLHVDTDDRVELDTWLNKDDRIGHASCEGGVSTGTHLHFARKYNGEWILADGPIPFVLSGWRAHAGKEPYEGTLTKDGKTIIADPVGTAKSIIYREEE
jgi:murein DD-endopeptidase MepM/ murein hydrolase activator NlpD